MSSYHLSALIATALGIIAIVLVIIGLTTAKWLGIEWGFEEPYITVWYDLIQRCNIRPMVEEDDVCELLDIFGTELALEVVGIVVLGSGTILGISLNRFEKERGIYLISSVYPFIGSTLLLIGSFLYMKHVIEDFAIFLAIQIVLNYSMILMLVTCITGFAVSSYIAFCAGYACRNNQLHDLQQ